MQPFVEMQQFVCKPLNYVLSAEIYEADFAFPTGFSTLLRKTAISAAQVFLAPNVCWASSNQWFGLV